MAGRTGKMTADALEARGPRHVLAWVGKKLVIFREDEAPAGPYSVIAKSFTLSYLRRIKKGNELVF